jgi:hypothetical protein
LSDLTTGSFFAAPYNLGSVYQVTFVPEPSATGVVAMTSWWFILRKKNGRKLSQEGGNLQRGVFRPPIWYHNPILAATVTMKN